MEFSLIFLFRWTVTGNVTDNYLIYRFFGSVEPTTGFLSYTACGAKEFMQLTANVTTDIEDGVITYEVIPPKSILLRFFRLKDLIQS